MLKINIIFNILELKYFNKAFMYPFERRSVFWFRLPARAHQKHVRLEHVG